MRFVAIPALAVTFVACAHDAHESSTPPTAPVTVDVPLPSPVASTSSAPDPSPRDPAVVAIADAGSQPDNASDPLAMQGNMWGDAIGESIPIADAGRLRQTNSPSLRQGATQVTGKLPPEVIQRIVRQNFGRFRLCYENALRAKPTLEGRVAIKFTIGTTGAVTSTADGGSDLPDPTVITCVKKGFSNLSFPQPEGGGTVIVVYPIIFAPGDAAAAPAAKKK